ncbi:bifunctional adenosylcobinamide kinase/adenosylcobinamide-phosphate guanylyltransferase [Pleurocapsales cyanobacterium LEGE 10410]|nr:bifunctional adenosylcobinamide kinase/adenosylcobinamide-phosphate guanylyltransferase [Pleurocapsales cyanobacterium LEGE 10410]
MSNTPKITLVTGASSSGKSEFAEVLAAKTNKSVVYLATAQVDDRDREWQEKIIKHQQRRPSDWQTLAISTELSSYIKQAELSQCLLIDSIGTWVTNFLDLNSDEWEQMQDWFLSSLQKTKAEIIIVGEETGWGVVPAYPLGRLFRDRLGNLSRHIGNLADATYLVAGGHVLNLSVLGEPLSKYKI